MLVNKTKIHSPQQKIKLHQTLIQKYKKQNIKKMNLIQQQSKTIKKRKQIIKKQQQTINETSIHKLNQIINQTYHKLQNNYKSQGHQNQIYLLTIFMRILDKMLDDVVFAQQKVTQMDSAQIKNTKCNQYVTGIVKYRKTCFDVSQILKQKAQQLKTQCQKTQKLQNQNQNLIILNQKKDKQLQKLKHQIQKIITKEQNMNTINQNKIEISQNQLSNPQNINNFSSDKTKRKIKQNSPQTQNKFSTIQTLASPRQKQIKTHSKSLTVQTDKKYHTLTNNNHQMQLPNIKLEKSGSPLWLYQPITARKVKLHTQKNNPNNLTQKYDLSARKMDKLVFQ